MAVRAAVLPGVLGMRWAGRALAAAARRDAGARAQREARVEGRPRRVVLRQRSRERRARDRPARVAPRAARSRRRARALRTPRLARRSGRVSPHAAAAAAKRPSATPSSRTGTSRSSPSRAATRPRSTHPAASASSATRPTATRTPGCCAIPVRSGRGWCASRAIAWAGPRWTSPASARSGCTAISASTSRST